MASAVFPDGPLFPALGAAAHLPAAPWFVAARRLDEAAAGKSARAEIFGRVLAPADIRQARATALDRIRLIQVPFWRVELSIDGFHVGFTGVRLGRGPVTVPVPLMSSKHRRSPTIAHCCSRLDDPEGRRRAGKHEPPTARWKISDAGKLSGRPHQRVKGSPLART